MRKNLLKKAMAVTAVVMGTMSLAGCSSAQEEDLSAAIAQFNASIPENVSGGGNYAGIKVGSVNMGMNGEWFSEVMNGIKDAAKDMGVDIVMLDSESDTKKEADNIETLMAQGVDVIVISPISSDETAVSLKKVQKAGIPIVTWNTTVNMEVTTMVGVDSIALGGNTGDYVVEYIKTNNLKNVNMLILGNTSYDIGIARCDGFKQQIQDLVDQGIINIVAEEEAETMDAAIDITKRVVGSTNVDMIWAWNQGALLGCIDAVKQAGKTDIVVMGTDMSMDLAYNMLGEEVNLQAVTTQLPYNMGYKAVVNAVKAASGEAVDSKVLIPLSTITKSETDRVEQYIENHKDLVQ